jgi:hypothetical protein
MPSGAHDLLLHSPDNQVLLVEGQRPSRIPRGGELDNNQPVPETFEWGDGQGGGAEL